VQNVYAALQQACGAAAFVLTATQHSLTGLQHSEPVEQQSLAGTLAVTVQQPLDCESLKGQPKCLTAASPATNNAPAKTTDASTFVNMFYLQLRVFT